MSQLVISRSLGAKLALLMIGVASMTAAAMTYLSATRFSDFIVKTIEESVTSSAERAAKDMGSTIEKLISETSVTISKVSSKSTDATKSDEDLSAALRNNTDIQAIALFKVDKSAAVLTRVATQSVPAGGDKRYIETAKRSMTTIVEEIRADESLLRDGRMIRNLMPATKMPLYLTAVKFAIPNQPDKYAILTIVGSMTHLQVILPQSRSTSAYVVDYKGSVFVSSDEQAMRQKKPVALSPLLKQALARKAPSGFIDHFMDSEGKEKAGSFSQVPGRIPLIVIMEKDRNAAFYDLTRMYRVSALSCVLILLIVAMVSFFSAGSVTKNLSELAMATNKIAIGNYDIELRPKSHDEVAALSQSVNMMAQKIRVLIAETKEKGRLEGEIAKELETARTVQSTFFPKQDISVSNLTVTGNYQPATQCGGDLWGHFTIRPGVELVFIADAMGHGVPAALVTAIAAATCQSVASILKENGTIDTSASALLRRLNHIILDAVDGKISMTFFASIIDFNTGRMTFSNAGHNFPVIITTDRADSRLGKSVSKAFNNASAASITLSLQGTPLGIAREAEYSEKSIDIQAGDKIFFFTDGLIENARKDGTPFGRKGLLEYICQVGEKSPDAIKQAVLKRGTEIFGEENLPDDVTVVVAEISPQWVKPSNPVDAPAAAALSLASPPSLDLGGLPPLPASEPVAIDFELPALKLKLPG